MTDEQKEQVRYFGFAAFVGVLLLLNLTGVFRTIFGLDTAAVVTVLGGYRIFYNSIAALLEGDISADLAICIAVIAALVIGEYQAGAEAMFVMLLGEGLEGYTAGRTNAAIHRFVEQMPRRARVLRGGVEVEVDVAELTPGDTIVVRAGERIAADGAVESGNSSIDESTITGESLPRDKAAGDEVFSGTLNGHGLLHVRVSRAGEETTLARVVKLVEEAKERRAPVERIADRAAKYFLPALLLAAGLTLWYTRDWLRTVAVLLVACPCALILATPTAMVAAIGGLARRGILVRGAAVLQQAARVDTVVFDKTGTVTEGTFEIVRVLPLASSETEVIRLAAAAERASDHVLAKVVVAEAERRGIAADEIRDARVLPGRGVECEIGTRTIRAGNAAFLAEHGIRHTEAVLEEADAIGATAILVAEDERLAGAILLRDRLREGIREAVAELEQIEISRVVMLTGDRRRAAEAVAREIGITEFEAELLPEQKLDWVRRLEGQGRSVAMAGDGINDAPALATASVGIAVAGASDITAEAAGVVYMPHSLAKLPQLFIVSRRAVATAWQNIFLFAGLVNVLAVAAAATGTIGPLGAAFTHQLSSFFVMLNSLRLLRVGGGAPRRRWSFDWRPKLEVIFARRREFARPMLIALGALVVLNGFYIVGPQEAGVIERLGRRVLPLSDPGLHYKLPWPVDRLTKLAAKRVNVIEVGFRSGATAGDQEPAAYEWNVQHRSGRFQRKPEESLMLSGDQNMIEVNCVIHWALARPDDFLLRQMEGETTVRAAAEAALAAVMSRVSLDAVLTSARATIENAIRAEAQKRLDRYNSGVEVLSARLLDVHPSVEVVDAFREVSAAWEEKNRTINEAEAYRNEQVALARGNGQAKLAGAEGYSVGRKNRATGDADRFKLAEDAFRTAPGPTETRLYLETMEQVLAGRRKLIVDASKGRRHLFLVEDGIEIGPALLAPPRRPGVD